MGEGVQPVSESQGWTGFETSHLRLPCFRQWAAVESVAFSDSVTARIPGPVQRRAFS